MVGTAHLKSLIHQVIKANNLRKCLDSGVLYRAGTVDMLSGTMVYADASDRYLNNIVDYIYASTAIPISMPIVPINTQLFVDGGICHVAPLRDAIQSGATDIICIVCQSQSLLPQGSPFNRKNIMDLITRDMDIITNAMVNNDLGTVIQIKNLLKSVKGNAVTRALAPYAAASVPRIIRPATELTPSILTFGTKDITTMIAQGKAAAQNQVRIRAKKVARAKTRGAGATRANRTRPRR